ncbi:MAG TPA: hypothetical protein VKE69_09600 [Planctomycetota bacterium]|nr:hypothetical protein [Planctomycetota bacterium]
MRRSRLAAVALVAASAPGSIDLAAARLRFEEARAISDKDGGALWGRPLYGPMLFVDPATRGCVANQADAEGKLSARESVFAGTLPADVSVANTATRWAGVHWTMVRWPLPEVNVERKRLLAHELFHRIQDGLGLPLASPENPHLDTKEGRISLRLEMRALAAALIATGADRRDAIADALLFRAHRRAQFPGAADDERGLEMNEGLAEYTGVRLCGAPSAEIAVLLVDALEEAAKKPSFVRSFAYASGPAYGILLDDTGAAWRKGLTPQSDLGEMLRNAVSLSAPTDAAKTAQARSALYGGRAIVAEETERDGVRAAREGPLRARLIDGPVLALLPGSRFSYSFDPSEAVAIQGVGTVYPSMHVSDEWGVLEVSKGALLVQEKGGGIVRLQIPAPPDRAARPLAGDGWRLDLADGWSLADGSRKGDATVRRKQGP